MAKLAELIESHQVLLASIDAWDNGRCETSIAHENLSCLCML